MSLAQRLSTAFDSTRHTKAELARRAKVTAASVSDWFSGETKTLKAEPLVRAAHYLDVRPLWLVAGEGPMRETEQNGNKEFAVGEPVKLYQIANVPWLFPLVDQARWEQCSLEERGYIQHAMNLALNEIEQRRQKLLNARPQQGEV